MEFSVVGYFSALRRVLTGQVHKRIDTKITGATISLRLKKSSNETYVVLAITSWGGVEYVPLDVKQFDQLNQAFQDISQELRADLQGYN